MSMTGKIMRHQARKMLSCVGSEHSDDDGVRSQPSAQSDPAIRDWLGVGMKVGGWNGSVVLVR